MRGYESSVHKEAESGKAGEHEQPRSQDVYANKTRGLEELTPKVSTTGDPYGHHSTLDIRTTGSDLDLDATLTEQERGVYFNEMSREISEVLGKLDSRRAMILKMRMGLPHPHKVSEELPFNPKNYTKELFNCDHTQDEITNFYPVQRSRIGVLEAKALRSIKTKNSLHQLKKYWNKE